jgi:putative membrane protein
MNRMMLSAALGAAFVLGACNTMNDPAALSAAGDMTPEAATPFVMMAGASDLYEIESSRLALQKAQRADVRQFAQMLIEHHTMTTEQVTAAARAAGMNPPPPQLMPMQQRMLDELRAASNAEFDRTYVRQQIPAHEMALALHSNYARSGDTPSLRAAASGAVPIVTQHLQQARQMNR